MIDSVIKGVACLTIIATAMCGISVAHAQQPRGQGVLQLYSIDRGFLFIEGRYVPRPYELRRQGQRAFVNDIDLETIGVDLTEFEERISEAEARRSRRQTQGPTKPNASGPSPITLLHASLLDGLNMDQAIFLVRGLRPIDYDLVVAGDMFRVLLDDQLRASAVESLPEWKPVSSPVPHEQQRRREVMSQWFRSFEPSPAFLVNAKRQIAELDLVEFENQRRSDGVLRLASLRHPLRAVMTLLVVLGFGHLLSHRPDMGWPSEGWRGSGFHRSLLLIAGFCILELAWTSLVLGVGSLGEKRPLGSQFISDPTVLAAVKATIVAALISLLYRYRRLALARQASWWCCLVLVLSAARWLVSHSMFSP